MPATRKAIVLMGAPPKLNAWQLSYVRRAIRLRRQLTNGALAKRFKVSKTTIINRATHKSKGELLNERNARNCEAAP